MPKGTKIEWCQETVNPLGWGCWGPGGTAEKPNWCEYCYAREFAHRGLRDCEKCRRFEPHEHFEQLDKLAEWKKPRHIFVQSMGDPFGDWVTDEQLDRITWRMCLTDQHHYTMLTKNPRRALRYFDNEPGRRTLAHLPHLMIGTSITGIMNAEERERLMALGEIRNTFEGLRILVSLEPYQVKVTPGGQEPDWLIIGGRSRTKALPAFQPPDWWITPLRLWMADAGKPIFIKDNAGYGEVVRYWPEGVPHD